MNRLSGEVSRVMMRFEGKDILVVEDNRMEARRALSYLEGEGASACSAKTLEEARRLVEGTVFDFVLLDCHLPDGLGLDLLREGVFPETTAVVVATADEDISLAVEAMRLGALDFLIKPYPHEELPLVFARGRDRQRSERQRRFEQEREKGRSDSFFFGRSMQSVQDRLLLLLRKEEKLRDRFPPILIEGETGTGKTLLARWVHENGARSGKPFIDVNCSNFSETLAESELFGHEKGAFTDARAASVGLFEAADGGTLFLDEIAALSPGVQAKLLKVIEEQSIRRVGGSKTIRVNVRLIGASIEPLQDLVREGRFREDLYQRLNLIRVALPPLRERREDLGALAELLLEGLCRRYRQSVPGLSDRAIRLLGEYSWPGNVRELQHELERALIFSDGDSLDFGLLAMGGAPSGDREGSEDWLREGWVIPEEGFSLEEANQALIRLALRQTGNNISRAARLLGVPRHVLRYRLEKSPGEE